MNLKKITVIDTRLDFSDKKLVAVGERSAWIDLSKILMVEEHKFNKKISIITFLEKNGTELLCIDVRTEEIIKILGEVAEIEKKR